MEAFHVSPIYNRNSILKNGLLPTIPKLPHHYEAFQSKVVYLFEDSFFNEKFIKDHVYTITNIQKRNELAEKNNYFDFSQIVGKNIYEFDQMEFDVYLCKVKEDDRNRFIHFQTPSNNKYNSLYFMHEEFSHENKPLYVNKEPIQNFEIIGKALYHFNHHGKISINVKC